MGVQVQLLESVVEKTRFRFLFSHLCDDKYIVIRITSMYGTYDVVAFGRH